MKRDGQLLAASPEPPLGVANGCSRGTVPALATSEKERCVSCQFGLSWEWAEIFAARGARREFFRQQPRRPARADSSAPVSMPDSSLAICHHAENAREAVVQDRERRHAEQRAMHRADAAEDARAAQHHRGDGEQFVAGAGIRLRLAERARRRSARPARRRCPARM